MTEVNITVGSHNKAQVRPVKPSAPSTETPISIAEVNAIFSSNTKAQERGVQSSGASSRAPSNMTKAKSTVDYNRKSQADTVKSSTSSTKAGPNWQQSDSEDPFGLRVSTEEFGTEPAPFDIALGKFHNTRDNIMYLGGYRDATAHFEELVPQIIQPLKPGVDLTPEPVKVFMAANTTRKEAAEAEMKATKAKELDVVRAQEIATASGLHEQFKNPVPTFGQTMGIAVANAKLEPTSAGAYSKLSNESMREIYEGLKGKGKDFTSVSMEEEEALGKSGVHRCADATTEEDEAPAKGWIHPVADRVIDNAQMQYDMMYGIVTQCKFFPRIPYNTSYSIYSLRTT
jgi:hypothetical protein